MLFDGLVAYVHVCVYMGYGEKLRIKLTGKVHGKQMEIGMIRGLLRFRAEQAYIETHMLSMIVLILDCRILLVATWILG